jgi:hypothetical protein
LLSTVLMLARTFIIPSRAVEFQVGPVVRC